MLRMFNHLNELHVKEKSLLIYTILKYQSKNESAKEVEKPNRDNKTINGNKEDTSKTSPEKGCFVNKTNQTSWARNYTYKSNLNVNTGSFSEASSSEEEDIGMHKGRRKINVENKNEDAKGKNSEEEEIKNLSVVIVSR